MRSRTDKLVRRMTAAFADVLGRRLVVLHLREQARPSAYVSVHELLVDGARRPLAERHRVGNVGRAGDQVAAGKEARTAGLQAIAVHLDGAAAA